MSWYDDEIERLKKEKATAKKFDERFDAAKDIRQTYESFISAGFTEEQSYELLTIILKK